MCAVNWAAQQNANSLCSPHAHVIVLDLDLDFFVHPTPFGWDTDAGKRASGAQFSVSPKREVREFLENRLGLSKERPVRASEASTHDGAFWYWRDEIASGRLVPPFEVVHVDNHSDLGMGDAGWLHLTTDVMRRELAERANPLRDEVTEGNYLAFAIAAGWISTVRYVAPACRFAADGVYRHEDRMHSYFLDSNPDSGELALPMNAAWSPFSFVDPKVLGRGPTIRFETLSAESFTAPGTFDSAFLAHSPQYTPKKADALLPLLREYLSMAADVV